MHSNTTAVAIDHKLSHHQHSNHLVLLFNLTINFKTKSNMFTNSSRNKLTNKMKNKNKIKQKLAVPIGKTSSRTYPAVASMRSSTVGVGGSLDLYTGNVKTTPR